MAIKSQLVYIQNDYLPSQLLYFFNHTTKEANRPNLQASTNLTQLYSSQDRRFKCLRTCLTRHYMCTRSIGQILFDLRPVCKLNSRGVAAEGRLIIAKVKRVVKNSNIQILSMVIRTLKRLECVGQKFYNAARNRFSLKRKKLRNLIHCLDRAKPV